MSKQKIRGIRGPIPPGYVLGRTGTGNGDVGLVRLDKYSTVAYVQQYVQSVVPVSANPTATASDTAVNGTATTFMTSDSAPAVQKASAAQFGLAKVDGTTITAAGGVISAVSTGGGGAMLPLTNGDLPGPGIMTDDKGQCIGVPL